MNRGQETDRKNKLLMRFTLKQERHTQFTKTHIHQFAHYGWKDILSSVFVVVDVLERLYCHDDGVRPLLLGATDRPVCAAPAAGNVGKVPGRSPRQRRVPHVDQERALVHNLWAAGGGGQGGRRWWWWWHGVISGRLPAASGDGDAVCTRAWHSLKCFVVLESWKVYTELLILFSSKNAFSVTLLPSSLSLNSYKTLKKNLVFRHFFAILSLAM